MVSQVLGPYEGHSDNIFNTKTVMEHWGSCRSTQEGLVLSGAGAKSLRCASDMSA